MERGGSTGSGGRAWKSVLWTANGKTTQRNLAALIEHVAALATTDLDVAPNGAMNSSTDTESGVYHVRSDGQIRLDFDPSMPGDDIVDCFSDAEASMILTTRQFDDTDGFLAILLRKSTRSENKRAK